MLAKVVHVNQSPYPWPSAVGAQVFVLCENLPWAHPLLRIASVLCFQPWSVRHCSFNVWQSMNCKHVLRREGCLDTGARELALKKKELG